MKTAGQPDAARLSPVGVWKGLAALAAPADLIAGERAETGAALRNLVAEQATDLG